VDSGRTFEPKNAIDEENTLDKSSVIAIAVDPLSPNIIYAGTDKNDVYVTRNGAESWQKMDTRLSNITNIVVDSFSTSTIYVSGMYNNRGSVVKSVDSGQTWERVYVEPTDGTNITAMTISPNDGNVVYIGTSGGTIAKTVAGGKTWKNLYNAEDRVNDILIDSYGSGALYVLVEGRDIFRSQDDVLFESISDLVREKELEMEEETDENVEVMYEGTIYSMAVSPGNPGVLVIGTDNGVFRSDDMGESWRSINVIASTIGIPIHAIEINPSNVNQLVYAAAKAVYTSVSDEWVITDTASNRVVNVIAHDPINSNNIYLGLRKAKK
ncbi:MAG: hypothetical protein ABFQ53_04130, partial [Patescibacteria group bacterium]